MYELLVILFIICLYARFNVFTLKTTFYIEHLWWLVNLLSANPTKWSNTLKQFVGKMLTKCLSVFDHFVK